MEGKKSTKGPRGIKLTDLSWFCLRQDLLSLQQFIFLLPFKINGAKTNRNRNTDFQFNGEFYKNYLVN